jgi:hypothetical protein
VSQPRRARSQRASGEPAPRAGCRHGLPRGDVSRAGFGNQRLYLTGALMGRSSYNPNRPALVKGKQIAI